VELLLIRHALPLRVENPDGTPADPALGPEGREQARRLTAWLEPEAIDALYASPMRRAVETARPLSQARELEIAFEPGVVEFDQNAPFYIPLEELKRTDYERWREAMQGALYAEIDIEKFRYTVVSTLERIVSEHRGQRVAVVCHGGVINAWAAHVIGVQNPLFFQPDYTSLHRFLCASSGERTVVCLNETAHLRERT
jgi:probable phosphoglycerate mutase